MDLRKKRSSDTKSGVFSSLSSLSSYLPSKRQMNNVYKNRIQFPAKKAYERVSKIVTGAYKVGGKKKSLKNRKKKSNKTLKKR